MGANPLYDLRVKATVAASAASKPRQTYQESHTVKCDYPYLDCEKRFETEQEMKQHKHNEPDHFFCKKCDKLDIKKRERLGSAYPPKQPGQFDFEDWDAFTVHKVDAMAPFVEGRQKPTDDNPPAHITCEFCGEDFKSFGGRKRHRTQNHPADQDAECPGCKQHFIRAYLMIQHLEKDRCPNIRPLEFFRNISHKYVLSQIMDAPHRFLSNLAANKTSSSKAPGRIDDAQRDEAPDEEEGGVSLLDTADEAQMGGYRPLVPEIDLIDMHVRNPAVARPVIESWPRLPGQDSHYVASSMSRMSIKSTANPATATTAASETTARREGTLKTQGRHDSILDSEEPTVSTQKKEQPSVWKSNTSEKLFPYSKEPKKPKEDGWNSILAKREAELAADDSTNLFKSRWWDCTSPDYSAERFYNEMEGYLCPFESCENHGLRFDSPSDLNMHMAHAHIRQVFGCPACQKRFHSPSSLVAHAESTRKCYVRDSAKFKKFIDDITGGYLQAKEIAIPKIYHTDIVIKKGPQVQGVMETKFTGHNPEDT